MNESNTEIIYGPPGTGKTTRLLQIVEEYLASGIPPESIIFVSFSRRAIHEAIIRAMRKFNFGPERFPWFKTLHALAFAQLGIKSTKVMGPSDYSRLARALNLHVTTRWSVDGLVSYQGTAPGDKMLAMYATARGRGISVRQLWEEEREPDIHWAELERVERTLNDYKRTLQKVDFVDMLLLFATKGTVPNHAVLIVDEAQDLSPAQWEVVHKLSDRSVKVYLAGDDDQAIFEWAGADSRPLLNLPGKRTVLPKSYRVPAELKNMATRILKRIKGPRIHKSWEPVSEGGEIHQIPDYTRVPLAQGKWLILCRNLYQVERISAFCYEMGLLFTSQSEGQVTVPLDVIQGVNCWNKLRRGETVRADAAVKAYSLMLPRSGYLKGSKGLLEKEDPLRELTSEQLAEEFGLLMPRLKTWPHALQRLDREMVLRIMEVESRMGIKDKNDILPEPNIRIMTVHSSKGTEEDNVLLVPDMTPRAYKTFCNNPDAEHRVWYVAVTRAKKSLWLLQPQTNYYYGL